jgi:hypothetical protein
MSPRVLRAGYLPPVAEGFQRFLQTSRSHDYATMAIAEAERRPKAEPHDSHPSLNERLAAIGATGPARDAPPPPAELAVNLLARDFSEELMRRTFGDDKLEKLRSIDWPAVANSVYVKHWVMATAAYAVVLARLPIDRFPVGRDAVFTLADYLHVKGLNGQRMGRVVAILGGAVALRLMPLGWTPMVLPGESPVFVKDAARVEPFEAIMKLANETLTLEAWTRQCEQIDLRGRLVSVPDEENAPAPLDLSIGPARPSVRSTRRRRSS